MAITIGDLKERLKNFGENCDHLEVKLCITRIDNDNHYHTHVTNTEQIFHDGSHIKMICTVDQRLKKNNFSKRRSCGN